MPHDGQSMPDPAFLADLRSLTADALPEVEFLLTEAQAQLKGEVSVSGKVSAAALEARQDQAHALSWLATYVEGLRQLQAWADQLAARGAFGPMETLILQIGFGEYLSQIAGGIPMSQL